MSAAFEYEYQETWLHKLNPITKLVLFMWLIAFSSLYLDPRYKVPALIFLIGLCRSAKFPFRKYLPLIWVSIIACLITYGFRSIFMTDADLFRVYPSDWVNTVILEITPPSFPVFGRTAITYGTLLWASVWPLSTTMLILSLGCFVYTTPMTGLLQVLYRMHLPFPVVYMTTVALRFIPELVRKLRTIQIAQSLRGWEGKTRNPIKAVALYIPLLIPVTRDLVQSIDVMTLSTKNRAFGYKRPQGLSDLAFTTVDALVLFTTSAALVVSMYLLFVHNIGNL